ncbi:formate C-acetyltransferase/glycerol dehydratase family glycyl radical enzyme [Vibrio sp. CAIM 722]|uniref:Formate C-acetyltransferase/glycerol dehydratase family glycyl radical enzyme n=1 Tax=Vibrio eleionomae TaxID=2653505 RepID=A0A7X4RWP7_9VIBR|nr:formate C-acetyltransferase/glycerol dehydratase family glycyl radical enzyme [Vibrio eleionomae]MZI95572.1 formate C-acetyltransferase/glycerol dehydratase family glycyl radical enzyme [Vibrio eleionomae]
MSVNERIERLRQNYVNSKPSICYERARIYTESHKRTEGQPVILRRAQAFYDFCDQFNIQIFADELVVGTAGKFRRTGILTPEFSWQWVDKEMDNFDKRPQDPYQMTDEQRDFVRANVFPYWKGQSLEEHFLAALPKSTAQIVVDTGIVDNDSKWRQAVGEITPDYQDVLFKYGFKGVIEKLETKMASLDYANSVDIEKIQTCQASILTSQGIIRFAQRYAALAESLAEQETNLARQTELRTIAKVCARVPKLPPQSFHEAIQFVWFTQLGGIISENPLALNPGRFDQYMYPYYQHDMENGILTKDDARELIQALWLKFSEWVWTISANTAGYFAGYNQFQNLTVGGKNRDGSDATNELTYLCLEATDAVKTHQPGLSVRVHADCPPEFMQAVTDLVSTGTGFPAIHNDQAGTQMLLQAGYDAEDARDWSNCGCVVPHFRKTGQWTSAVNVNFAAAMEYALNNGKSRLTGEHMGDDVVSEFTSYQSVEDATLSQIGHLIRHSVISTLVAQRLHEEMVPRPFLSACIEDCIETATDLSKGGAKYNIGPVLTGIGLAIVANSLAVIKKLVFEDKVTTMAELNKALDSNWEGFEALRAKALDVPKYGNDDDYVDGIARTIANYYYRTTREYHDIFGSRFNSAFMGISNYIPTGRVVGATPCGRLARQPITEGVSPFAGSDVCSPLAAMRSSAKMNHDVHTGGTLLNLRLSEDVVKTAKGRRDLGNIIRAYFSLGAFHVQFNTLSTETLRKAQKDPDQYRDLLVRVAGYSTQFVNLSPEMQEAIIARSAHGSCC